MPRQFVVGELVRIREEQTQLCHLICPTGLLSLYQELKSC